MMSAKKSNILFLLHTPPPVHGSSIVGLSIVESKKINDTYNCRFINLLVSKTINETGKSNFYKLIRFIKIWFKIFLELIKNKPDLCYFAITSSGIAFYKDLLIVILLRLFKIKIVYHLHNKGFSINQNKKLYKLLYKFIFKDSEVILLSKLLYSDIERFVPFNKVHICANGIKVVESAIVKTNENKDITTKTTNLLFLSNLIESKGVYVLLDACKILERNNINFECSFIGGEGDISVKQLNDKIKLLGLETKVKYEGKKYGSEKYNYLKFADIFVFPTYYNYECFPLVLLEAMQFSLPVISTFEGGIPDIIENEKSGYIVPQKDVLLLAEKLEILINNYELRNKMGYIGRMIFEERFTFERFEHNFCELLNKILTN